MGRVERPRLAGIAPFGMADPCGESRRPSPADPMIPMKAVSLRTITIALTLSVLLTSALIGAWLLYRSWTAQRDLMQSQLVRHAQTLSDSVDRELAAGARTLQAIALGLPDDMASAEAALLRRAHGLLSLQPDLRAVALNRVDGTQVWNTRSPGSGVRSGEVFAHEKKALASMQPLVSDLYESRSSGDLIASYVVPLELSGEARLLVGAIDLDDLPRRLGPLASEHGAVAALIDGNGRLVARTVASGDWLGEPVGTGWAAAFGRPARAGATRLVTREGIDAHGAWARMPASGWTLLVAVPAGPHERALIEGLLMQLAAAAALAGLGALVAYTTGRELVRSARRLAGQAERMVVKRELARAPTGVTEFDTIQQGLAQAAALLKQQDEKAQALERSRAELLESERAARHDAEQANRFKDESLGVLGHEMRNPLAAIGNAALVLQHRLPLGDRGAHLVRTIHRQVCKLTRLVNDLTEVGRLIGGKVRLDRRPVDMAEVVREAVDVLQLARVVTQHAVRTEIDVAWVLGDADRLQQVVINLLTNAARYSPTGSTIRLVLGEGSADPSVVELRVQDEGIGMRPEDLDRVFDLFVQIGSRRPEGSLGVGLSVVRRLVALHGGQVRAESDGLGHGTTFVVTLPALSAAGREQAPVNGRTV